MGRPINHGSAGSRLPEQILQLVVNVDEVALGAGWDDAVGAPQEFGGGTERRLEMCLAEWGRERDVQDVRTIDVLWPDLDIALAYEGFEACCEQFSREDPLNRLIGTNVKCHLDGIRIVGAVVETGHQGNGSMLGNHQAEAQLSGDRNAVHHGVMTFALLHHGETVMRD